MPIALDIVDGKEGVVLQIHDSLLQLLHRWQCLCQIKDYDLASKEIIKVKKHLEKNLSEDTIILGPTTASMFKVNNIYRFQIILKYKKTLELNILMFFI